MRLAIDIGGTFTDVVVQRDGGEVETVKVFTTSGDITEGVMTGFARAGVVGGELESFVHGTTVALNALLEGKTPPVGLITTAGFRDVLEIMRTNRPDHVRPPAGQAGAPRAAPTAARDLRADRRTDGSESSCRSMPSEVRGDRRAISPAGGIDAIAVCLLHAYANPAHERAVAGVVRAALPEATCLDLERPHARCGASSSARRRPCPTRRPSRSSAAT